MSEQMNQTTYNKSKKSIVIYNPIFLEEKRTIIISDYEIENLNKYIKWLDKKMIVDYTGFCIINSGDFSNSLKSFMKSYMTHSCEFENIEQTVAWLMFYIRLFSAKRFYEVGLKGEPCQEDAEIKKEIYYFLSDVKNRITILVG